MVIKESNKFFTLPANQPVACLTTDVHKDGIIKINFLVDTGANEHMINSNSEDNINLSVPESVYVSNADNNRKILLTETDYSTGVKYLARGTCAHTH